MNQSINQSITNQENRLNVAAGSGRAAVCTKLVRELSTYLEMQTVVSRLLTWLYKVP
jgi:hypothetical protein